MSDPHKQVPKPKAQSPKPNPLSILRHLGVNSIGPGENSARQVVDSLESSLAQEVHGLGATNTTAAMGHNFLAGVEFVYAVGEIAQWNQVPAEIADLVFVRLADVEYEYIVTAVEALLQFFHLHFRCGHFRSPLFSPNAAEFLIVD